MKKMNITMLCIKLTIGLSLTCSTLFAADSLEQKTPIDVILVAGQSNAVGVNAKPGQMGTSDADKSILFWWRCGDPEPDDHDSTSDGQWQTLQAQPRGNPIPPPAPRAYGNFGQPEGGFGPEIGLARAVFSKEKQPLAVIKVAFSGTNLATDWRPTAPDASGGTGACYRSLITETQAALAALDARGFTPRLRAIAWIQGESDATVREAPKYEANLTALIADLRKNLAAPDMAALLCLNVKFKANGYPMIPDIIAAQQAVASKVSRTAYVDTTAATTANAAHFDSAGNLSVGKWLAQALWELEEKNK
ncbi:MAG: sialate O-acetylesterase [Lentisphaerota bacterium]